MRFASRLVYAGCFGLLLAATAVAEDVRYVTENGVTYRETRERILRPLTETRYEERQQTVYREQYVTEVRETSRPVPVAITEYRWEAYWEGRWNPFRQPTLAYRLVPYTRWEVRNEVVREPVTRRDLVPETRVTRVPITTRRMVEEEVIRRVAVDSAPPGTSTVARSPGEHAPTERTVRREPIGGVARLDNDPPRESSSDWRPAETFRR